MALKWIDHTKTGEPLPDSHPLSKGSMIMFGGGLVRQLHAQKASHELRIAEEALEAAKPEDVPALQEQVRKARIRYESYVMRPNTEE